MTVSGLLDKYLVGGEGGFQQVQGSLGGRAVVFAHDQVIKLQSELDREISSLKKKNWAYTALVIVGLIGACLAGFVIKVCIPLGILCLLGAASLSAFSRGEAEYIRYEQMNLSQLKTGLPKVYEFAQEQGIVLNRQNLEVTAETVIKLARAQTSLKTALEAQEHAGEREAQAVESARKRLSEIQQDLEDLKNHGTIYRIEKPS